MQRQKVLVAGTRIEGAEEAEGDPVHGRFPVDICRLKPGFVVLEPLAVVPLAMKDLAAGLAMILTEVRSERAFCGG